MSQQTVDRLFAWFTAICLIWYAYEDIESTRTPPGCASPQDPCAHGYVEGWRAGKELFFGTASHVWIIGLVFTCAALFIVKRTTRKEVKPRS